MFTWFHEVFNRKKQPSQPRLCFSINDVERLETLRFRGGHTDNQDLINHALTIYQWALDTIEEGRIVAGVNERDDTYRELSMPVFEQLKSQIPWGTWEEPGSEIE